MSAHPHSSPLDQQGSTRLAILRFPLIVGVVFVHAYETAVHMAGQTIGVSNNSVLADFVRNLISQGLARTAVPLFFLMSGYLFFLGWRCSRASYLVKLASRSRSLLLPFLFWNLAALLATALAQSYPPTAQYFSGRATTIANFSLFDSLNALLGLNKMPIAYQFWFIRDLMLLALVSPLIYGLLHRCAAPFMLLVLGCWIVGYWPLPVMSVEATLFFSLGGWVAQRGKSLFAFDGYAKYALLPYVVILGSDALLYTSACHPYLQKAGIVLGVVVILAATGLALRSAASTKALLALGAASFFVFAAHEPVLTLARKLTYKWIDPSTDLSVIALYFAIPIAVILILLAVYRALTAWLPGFTRVITGGR